MHKECFIAKVSVLCEFDRLYQENWLEQCGNEKRSIELEYSLASLGVIHVSMEYST